MVAISRLILMALFLLAASDIINAGKASTTKPVKPKHNSTASSNVTTGKATNKTKASSPASTSTMAKTTTMVTGDGALPKATVSPHPAAGDANSTDNSTMSNVTGVPPLSSNGTTTIYDNSTSAENSTHVPADSKRPAKQSVGGNVTKVSNKMTRDEEAGWNSSLLIGGGICFAISLFSTIISIVFYTKYRSKGVDDKRKMRR